MKTRHLDGERVKGVTSRPLCIQQQPLSQGLAECLVGTPLSHPFLGAQTTLPKPDVPICP